MNPNKVACCTADKLNICFTDSKKSFSYPYKSVMEEVQLYGNARYQGEKKTALREEGEIIFTPEQNRLYKQAVHGLSLFTERQLKVMQFKEKLSIENRYNKAQRVLNRWKQTIVSDQIDDMLLKLYPSSGWIKKFVQKTKGHTDDTLVDYSTFAELGITKVQIARKLVGARVLPENFFRT